MGRPATREVDPQQGNARQLAKLSMSPPKRTPPPPPPDAPTIAYRLTLGRIAQESYKLAADTVLAEVRRLQELADAYRADSEEERAAEQDHPHTPEEKEALDVPESLDAAIVVLQKRANTYAGSLDTDKITAKHAKQIETFNRGVTLQVLSSLGLNPIPPGSKLADAREQWVRENAALIVSQPLEVAERCGQVVREMVPGGSRWETIAKHLEEEQGIATRRAALIARDQVSKYNADLTRIQQQSAGIEYYMWQGAMDNRERPSHVALQGTVWSWDKPPPVGNPGEPIQCRCFAVPVTSDELKKRAVDWTPEELAARTADLGPTQREGPDATQAQVAKRAAREVAAEVKLAKRQEFIKKPVEDQLFPRMIMERARVAFGQEYNAVIATMTSRERDAVAFYTGNDYMAINRYLRVGQEDPEHYVHKSTKREIADLRGLLERTVVPMNVTAYRGTGRESVINTAYEEGKLTPGTNITDRGFLSTSLDETVAKQFQARHGGVILEIEVPKGSKGLYVGMRASEGTTNRHRSAISSVSDESELLMQKGRTLKVLSVETVKGVAYVKVRLH